MPQPEIFDASALSNTLSKTRAVTTSDVALRAGVARPTVSAVLNGARSNTSVSLATRERILAAAQELGYRPNLAAKAVRNRRSMLIGVLVRNEPTDRSTHPLTWGFALGINDGLADSGYTTALIRLTDMHRNDGLDSPVFQGHLLDGLIVVNHIPRAVEERVESLVPQCVWLDSNVWRESLCVRRDEIGAGERVAHELAARGYEKMLVLAGDGGSHPHYSWMQRLEGLQKSALPCEIRSLEHKGAPAELAQAFADVGPRTGVVALDAYIAQKVAQFAGMSGRHIGRDFGLVCCDDLRMGHLDWPELARVSFNRYEMGHEAAQLMLQALNGASSLCESRLIRGHWIEGETLPALGAATSSQKF